MTVKNVNVKKPLKLKNNTKYFMPGKDKVQVQFSSPSSYSFRKSKIEGYENRLYWQYRYCDSVGGQTFYYTLTYNDAHIPNHYGINCFDYEDLRDLFTGGFRKLLLRSYGTTFKYFVGAELGDGKGSRGLHNNPHYHVIFFLEPDKGTPSREPYPYIRITPEDFRTIIKRYWQGFDEAVDGKHDYREAIYGIAKEGDDIGLVHDFRACMYCAKYVCKDVSLVSHESHVEASLLSSARSKFFDNEEVYTKFYKTYINSTFNVPCNVHADLWFYSDIGLYQRYFPDHVVSDVFGNFTYKSLVFDFCNKYNLWSAYQDFLNSFIDVKVQEGLKEYRNRFCNKCRISHGVGDYALDFVDKLNPSIQVPAKDGFKDRPIGQYYYRKLFCDVVKDSKGSNIYLLKPEGIEYKVSRFIKNLDKKAEKALNYFKVLDQNPDLYDRLLSSDVNLDVSFSFDHFNDEVQKLLKFSSFKDICYKYGEYKLVYEDRFFPFDVSSCDISCVFPSIDVMRDYRRFLVPSFYSVSRSDLRLDSFLDSGCKGYLSYSSHPYFLRYLCVFRVLDLCSDYFFVQKDDKEQREAEERQRIIRFHKKRELKQYYSDLFKS